MRGYSKAIIASGLLLALAGIQEASLAQAQETLSEWWRECRGKLESFTASGTVGQMLVGDDGQPFNVVAKFRLEKDGDKFFAELFPESKSEGIQNSLVPQRLTIVGDGQTIWTCWFHKNHSKGGIVRIYDSDEKDSYTNPSFSLWLDLRKLDQAFYSAYTADNVPTPRSELGSTVSLEGDHGIEYRLILDEHHLPQMTVTSLATKERMAKTTSRYLFSQNTLLPKYKRTTYVRNGAVHRDCSIRLDKIELGTPSNEFSFLRLESPEDPQVMDYRRRTQSGAQAYVPFTPKSP